MDVSYKKPSEHIYFTTDTCIQRYRNGRWLTKEEIAADEAERKAKPDDGKPWFVVLEK